MSIPLLDTSQPTEEKLITLHGISWGQFKAIEAQLEKNQEVRLTYKAGVMEIMSSIRDRHEYVRKAVSSFGMEVRSKKLS